MKKEKKQDIKLYYLVDAMNPINIQNIHEHQKELACIENDLKNLNLNRGAGNASGFVFEYMHATDKNIEFLKDGKDDVIHVLSNNGVADFEITNTNGVKQFQQAKAGYHGPNKYKISGEKYAGQTFVVDKGNIELSEYLEKNNLHVEQSNITKEQAERLTKAMKKEVKIRQNITKDETMNAPLVSKIYGTSCKINAAHGAGIRAVKSVAPFAAGMSFGENLCQYMGGDIEIKEALGNVAVDTAKTAGKAYISSAAIYLASDAIQSLATESMKTMAKETVGMIVKTSGGKMLVSVGKFLAEMSVSFGSSFLIGLAIGCGKAVCQMVAATERMQARRISKAKSVLNQTINVMERAYEDLDKTVKEEFEKWDNSVANGFKMMKKGTFENSFEVFAEGLNEVSSVISCNVLFANLKEFDEFFFDDDAVLEL